MPYNLKNCNVPSVTSVQHRELCIRDGWNLENLTLHIMRDGGIKSQYGSIPEPKENEALIEVKTVILTLADKELILRARYGTNEITKSHTGGLLASGIIAKPPKSKASLLKKGDKVILAPLIWCKKCKFCLRGQTNLCETLLGLGLPPTPGAMTRFISFPLSNIHPLPERASFLVGAMAFQVAKAIHVYQRSNLKSDDDVVILGASLTGLIMSVVFKAVGIRTVVILDSSPIMLAIAKQNKVDYALDFGNSLSRLKTILIGVLGSLPKVVINAQTSSAMLEMAAGLVDPFGTIVSGETINHLPGFIGQGFLSYKTSYAYNEKNFSKALTLLNDPALRAALEVFPYHLLSLEEAAVQLPALVRENTRRPTVVYEAILCNPIDSNTF